MRRLVLLLLCASAVAVLPSCTPGERSGRSGAAEMETSEQAVREGEIPVRHDFSFTAGIRMRIPEGFPDDVALYPEAELKMSRKKSPREFVVVLATADPPSRVESWYREKMAGTGWRPTREADLDDRHYLRFEKVDRVAAVGIDPEGSDTLVSIACTVGNGYP